MTIDELVALQADRGLGDDHLVYLGEDRWVCAHTNAERAEGMEAMVDCDLNDWLESWGMLPLEVGLYIVVPYKDDWEFLTLDDRNLV